MDTFCSRNARYTMYLGKDKKRIQFFKGYYQATSESESKALKDHSAFGVKYCLDHEFPTRFGMHSEKDKKIFTQTLDTMQKNKADAANKMVGMTNENEKLKQEIERLKKGSSNSVESQAKKNK